MDYKKQDREKAVRRALANSALEGLQPSPEFLALLDQYVKGEITLDSALEYTREQYKSNVGES